MTVQKLLLTLRFLGIRQALRSVVYSLGRDWLETRYRARRRRGLPLRPGRMLEARSERSGGVFSFERAKLEVSFLAPDLVRLTWGPGDLPVPYALGKVDWAGEDVHTTEADGGWEAAGSEVRVVVSPRGSVRLFAPHDRLLHEARPPYRRGKAWSLHAPLQAEAHVYGLGERAARLNLRPGAYRLWNQDPGGTYGRGADPLYLTMPALLCLQERGGYFLFFENSNDGWVAVDESLQVTFQGGCLRMYFIPGPPERALERYTQLVGRAPLPPLWALGYHQSRWGYTREADVRAIVDGFTERQLPLSAVHLDIDYMRGYRVFTVDRQRFPDLRRLSTDLGGRGVRLVTILDPALKVDPGYEHYASGRAEGVFATRPDGKVQRAPVWPGWAAFPDFTSPEVRAWWGEWYAPLLEQGVAGFWHDMNEPAAFAAWGDISLPRPTRHALEGRGGDHTEAHNVYGLLMNRAGFEAVRRFRPGRRPFLLSRSGWAGLQRYAWNWTGDTESTWEALRQTIPTVLGLGLSGIPYSGPDVGGFSGSPSAELYLRWFQMAALLPFFRTHSAVGSAPREPWRFGDEILTLAREFLRLRYRLLPYLYTLAWEAAIYGYPIVRPLFWADPGNAGLWGTDDAFLLGDALLVAPALEEGAAARDVPLPAGGWVDFWDGERFQGPVKVTRPTPLERIPLFVRAGSVLPHEEGGRLILNLYPDAAGDQTSRLYSDAGDGYGPGRLDTFQLRSEGGELELDWSWQGEYEFPYPRVEVRAHGFRAAAAWSGEASVDPGELSFERPFRNLRLGA